MQVETQKSHLEPTVLEPTVIHSTNAQVKGPHDAFIEKLDKVWNTAAEFYFRFADGFSDNILYVVNRGNASSIKDEKQAKLTVYRVTIIAATLGAGFIGLSGGIVAGAVSLAARIGLIYFSTRALDEGCKNDLRTSFARETYQTAFYISAFSVAARLTGGLVGLAALTGAVYFATKAEDEANSSLTKTLNYAGAALCTMITLSEMTDIERITANLFQTTLHALTVVYAFYRTDKKDHKDDVETTYRETPVAVASHFEREETFDLPQPQVAPVEMTEPTPNFEEL